MQHWIQRAVLGATRRIALTVMVSGLLLVACGESEISGAYEGSYGGRPYKVTFMEGHAVQLVSPHNGQSFSGTYTIEGRTIRVDLGFGKQILQMVDGETLNTNENGTVVQLKRR